MIHEILNIIMESGLLSGKSINGIGHFKKCELQIIEIVMRHISNINNLENYLKIARILGKSKFEFTGKME